MSKKVLLYIDDFNMISKEIQKNLNTLKQKLKSMKSVQKCIILIKQETNDLLTVTERKHLLNKTLDSDKQFVIKTTKLAKTFKIMKKFETSNIEIETIYVDSKDKNFFESGLKGLPIKIQSFDTKDRTNDIVDAISKNEYKKYVNLVPTPLIDEWEWMKEKLSGRMKESVNPHLSLMNDRFSKILELMENKYGD